MKQIYHEYKPQKWHKSYPKNFLLITNFVILNSSFYITFAIMLKTANILNKKAKFDYEIIDTYSAGIVLTGTEIKSIRLGKAQIAESLWV